MRVRSLRVYPVKSTAGLSVRAADVDRAGLRGDRRWMVVDVAGDVLTARTHPALLRVTATPDQDDGVLLTAVELRFAEHCDRCVLTTIDPITLQGGKEPVRTLARYRRWAGHVWFGVRMVPLGTGTVSVGDPALAWSVADGADGAAGDPTDSVA